MRRNRSLGRFLMLLMVSAFLVNTGSLPAEAKAEPGAVAEGKTLPKFKLDTPADPEMKQYLGLDGQKKFTLDQLPSRLIVVEVFSALCPTCLENAPRVNKLYNIISGDAELKSRIVMLGIGVDNEDKLVRAYQKKFNVKFPLFSDPDGEIDSLLTGVSTPTLIIADNSGKVLFVHGGLIDDMDYILAVIHSIQDK